MSDVVRFVIFDHERNLYWRANSCGYAAHIHDAGLYTQAECDEITCAFEGGRNFTVQPAPSTAPNDVIVAVVREAMRDAWNDICSDSGFRPRDLQGRGKRLYFEPSTWAALTGEMVAVELRKRGILQHHCPAHPQAQGDSDGK